MSLDSARYLAIRRSPGEASDAQQVGRVAILHHFPSKVRLLLAVPGGGGAFAHPAHTPVCVIFATLVFRGPHAPVALVQALGVHEDEGTARGA